MQKIYPWLYSFMHFIGLRVYGVQPEWGCMEYMYIRVNHHTFLVGLYNTFIFYETKYLLYCFYLSKWRNAYIYLYFICRSTHIASLTHFIPDDQMYINIVMRFFFLPLRPKLILKSYTGNYLSAKEIENIYLHLSSMQGKIVFIKKNIKIDNFKYIVII